MMRSFTKIVHGRSATLVLSVLLVLCAAVSAAAEALSEEQVKAAFLYNFAKFVAWPAGAFAGPHDPIVFGVLGKDPVGDAVQGLSGRTVQGRAVVVMRYQRVLDVKVCHVLFIGRSEQDRIEDDIQTLSGTPILLVADSEQFARRGGMINFVLERNRVGFEINLESMKRSKLVVNAQLLKLARTVY